MFCSSLLMDADFYSVTLHVRVVFSISTSLLHIVFIEFSFHFHKRKSNEFDSIGTSISVCRERDNQYFHINFLNEFDSIGRSEKY